MRYLRWFMILIAHGKGKRLSVIGLIIRVHSNASLYQHQMLTEIMKRAA